MYIKQVRWEIKPPFDGVFLSLIFVPKITGIGQLGLLLKLWLVLGWYTFLRHGAM